MRTFKKRIIAALTTLGVLSSIVIGAGFGNSIESKQLQVHAFESENSSHVTTAYNYVENALFPCHGKTRITQTAYENGTPPSGDPASHKDSVAMDVVPDNDEFFHAPYSGRIVAYSDRQGRCNAFIFQSENKVRCSDDSFDYLSMYILHSNDDKIIRENMNKLIRQNEAIESSEENEKEIKAVRIGGASGPGNYDTFGEHFDIQIRKGKNNSIGNVRYNGTELHYNCLFINPEYTSLVAHSTYDRAFNIKYEQDPYQGYWVERNAFKQSSNTSTMKVSCPNSLAFEDDYSISQLLFGDVIKEQADKLDQIRYVVDNYTTIEYDSLSDFQKYVYDSCTYEWIDTFPSEGATTAKAEAVVETTEAATPESTAESIVENTEQPITERTETTRLEFIVKFDPNGGVTDIHEMKVTWGICPSEAFPTPEKSGSVFLGWYDIAGDEYTTNSIINQNLTLYAKWQENIVETLIPPISTIIVSQTIPAYVEPNVIETEYVPPTTTITTTKPLEITAESISLNRCEIMLNTAGKSRTYQLHSTINPTNVTDTYISWSSSDPSVAAVDAGLVVAKSDGPAIITAKTKNGKTAICTVTVKTSYDKIMGEWSEYSTTPISKAANIEIDTEILPVSVLRWIVTDSYTTRNWERERQFRNFSINPRDYGLDTGYGQNAMSSKNMFGVYLTFSPEEFEKFRVIKPGEWSSGNQSGQNMGTENGYEYIDGYIVFIKERVYEDIPMTHYRYRTVTEVPTVFVN